MHKEIAKWLYDKIMSEGDVYQSEAVQEIAEKFGEDYTYLNENDNPAIDRKVLEEFRKLKHSDIEWDRSSFYWHKKTELDRQLESMTPELPKMEPLPKIDLPKKEDFDNLEIQ
jgi:hypothetical protein